MQPPVVPRLFFQRPNPSESRAEAFFNRNGYPHAAFLSSSPRPNAPSAKSSPARSRSPRRVPDRHGAAVRLVPEREWYQSTADAIYRPSHRLPHEEAEEAEGVAYASALLEPHEELRLERELRRLACPPRKYADELFCDALAAGPRPLRSRSAGALFLLWRAGCTSSRHVHHVMPCRPAKQCARSPEHAHAP